MHEEKTAKTNKKNQQQDSNGKARDTLKKIRSKHQYKKKV